LPIPTGVAKAGPKTGASNRPLVERDLPAEGGERVCAWIEQFCITPKGQGAGQPMVLQPWQRDLIKSAFDTPRPRLGLWSIPRGNGKSSLSAAIALYALHGDGVMGASVVVVAKNEQQARIIFNAAKRMTELNPLLAKRSYIYTERIDVPGSGSSLQVYAAEAGGLEGLDPSLALIDEIGEVDRRVFEVIMDASGKRPTSLTLCIGTPSPHGTDSVMWGLRTSMLEDPTNPLTTFTEFAAPKDCELDDEAAWAQANPALGTFLFPDALRAGLPPVTREARFRRARLGQWTEATEDQWMEPGVWHTRSTGQGIPPNTPVVLAMDGSHRQDITALVAVSCEEVPHIDVVGFWANPGDPGWQVPILDVEEAALQAAKKWRVREFTADPFLWRRSLQVLGKQGLTVTEFPQTSVRMTPATVGLAQAASNGQVTHSGHRVLAEHVANARVVEDYRGTRLRKEKQHSDKKIDLAVAACMGWARATYYASKPQRRKVVAW